MYLKRDRLIRKQITINRASANWKPLPQPALKKLESAAHEQLSLGKIISREMDYSRIELFLLLSTPAQRQPFYAKLRSDLAALFNDQKAQKTFENKWTLALKSNVMGCFTRLARDFFAAPSTDPIRTNLTALYADTLERLFTQDKLSRIEEKFLQPFLTEAVKLSSPPEAVLGPNNAQKLGRCAGTLSRSLGERQTPKTLTSNQFLKYCGLRWVGAVLPHEKYLHNQLLHAPNPKYLLPFRRRGTFLALTNELLLKSNKLDLVGCQFWSYYEYEEGDLYERIRRAAQWGGRVDVLLALIRPKLVVGLERCLNLTNQKVIYFSSRPLTEEGLNSLMALVETALCICKNRDPREPLFDTALERIDLGQVFQNSLLREARLRGFILALLELYLLLLAACPKRHLRLKFVPHLAQQLHKLLEGHRDNRFTGEVSSVVVGLAGKLSAQERAQLLFGVVEAANHQWECAQESIIGNEVAQLSPHSVRVAAELVAAFGFEQGRAEQKVLKLEFYYILALNYKDSEYFESKQKLSRTLLDLNPSLTNNSVFAVLQTKKATHDAFKTHLLSLYGQGAAALVRPEHEGLLAAIDEVVTYRIQQIKILTLEQRSRLGSFYALMVSLLEQVERLEPSGKLLKLVRAYFLKCKRTYFIQVVSLKGRDETRAGARELITQDVGYLVQGCVSANPTVAEFSWEILQQYIQKVPELAIYTGVLVVWAECISILYRKSNQEYESRSERLRGKWLVSGTAIPTERKVLLSRLGVLLRGLYAVVLRGHLIDDDYLDVRVQYLIRQNCKSASFGFGWKCLKHLTNSFKQDHDFLAKEVLTNNSCSWFVNQEYFNSRLKKVKPDKVLLDKSLIPLHEGEVTREHLKKIFQAVEPQVETEFVTIPPKYSEGEVDGVVKELGRLCAEIEEREGQPGEAEEGLQELYGILFDVVSRVKMIYITKLNQAVVFAQILDVCRRFANFRLLQHTLLKIVPFFYCLNEFNWRIVDTLAQILHFVVSELNTSARRPLDPDATPASTFDARHAQFAPLRAYEANEKGCDGGRHRVLSSHVRRVGSLKLMYGELVQFFGRHMHVCIAKGFPLSLLLRVFSLGFLLQREVVAQLPLESVCRGLLSQLELVNVLKSALQKGENSFDEAVVDDFYLKTLKLALSHFQKEDSPQDELITPSFQLKQLRQRIDFLVQICDYLRNDDFHQLSKKKLPKRNELFAKRQPEILLLQMLDFNQSKANPRHRQPQQTKTRPVSSSSGEQVDLQVLRYSLLYLIAEQIDRTKGYAYPQLSSIANPYSLAGKKGFISNQMVEQLLAFFGKSSDRGAILVYNFLRIFGDRVENPSELMNSISALVAENPVYNYPPFLALYVERNKEDPSKLRELNYWRAPHIPVLLGYLSPAYEQYPSLQRYVTKVLGQLQADQILFYLPQIFQALPLASGELVAHFLLEYARRSSCFAHQLIWLAQVESKQERDPHNKSPRLPGVEPHLARLQTAAVRLTGRTVGQFSRQERGFFREVNDFLEQVTAISGKMRPQMAANDKKDIIRAEVERIVVPSSAYLPFNPTFQVKSINRDSGTPMQSAAKCPFLLSFHCQPYAGPDHHFQQLKLQRKHTRLHPDSDDDLPQEESVKPMHDMPITGSRVGRAPSALLRSSEVRAESNPSGVIGEKNKRRGEEREIACIFKVFDDIRQDCLALQVVRLFQQIFQRHGLGLLLFPYHTLPNRTGSSLDIGGIIEVVANCVSRDSIGKTNEQSLYEFFLNNFGQQHNGAFQQARENFIRSQAAYSVVSYLLQVKDRHNGNILVDKQRGCLVHIDFGFILDISPANNLKFERAHFKLTDEMIRIMGGSVDSEPFQLYLTLVIKGFLLARRYHQHVQNLVALMALSGLPCFLARSLQNLQARFLLHLSEIQAAEQMREIVMNAADHWTTNWYDRIQWMQQKIYH